MIDQFANYFNTLYANLPTWQNTQDSLKGFGNANAINIAYEYSDAMERGASPNSFLLRVAQVENAGMAGTNIARILDSLKWTRMSWLVTPFMLFLPILINGWPRANANNEKFNQFKDYCHIGANYLKSFSVRSYAWYYAPLIWLIQALGYALQATHWFLGKIPPLRNRFIINTFNLLDKYLLPLSLLLTIGAYFGLFLIGQEVLAIAAGLTLTYGVLDRMNLIPMFARNFVKKWGVQVTMLSNLFFGGIFEKIIGVIALPFMYGHYFASYFKNGIINVLGKFNATKKIAISLKKQSRTFKTFHFRVHASQFADSLKTMNSAKREIIRSHVLDNNELLPPNTLHKQNVNELIQLFDKIKWKKEDRKVIEANRSHDWRIKRDQLKEGANHHSSNSSQQLQTDLKYLKSNLKTFVKRVKNKDIHSVKVGAEDLLERYTLAIISLLKKLDSVTKDLKRPLKERNVARMTLVDTLIVLGFETGDYCGIGLLRAVESAYRNLFSENKELKLKQCVRFIHQMHRESFFQEQYFADGLNAGDQRNDSHAYSRAVAIYAPRLGLPAQFAENDELMDLPPIAKDFFSAISFVEEDFWKNQLSVSTLKRQLRNAFNTPLLPCIVVDKWYRKFIDKHVVGTEEELETLKDDYPPYTVENHGGVFIYKLKDAVLNLMLLDFGVIALAKMQRSDENKFVALKVKAKPKEQGKKANPILNFKHKNNRSRSSNVSNREKPQMRKSMGY